MNILKLKYFKTSYLICIIYILMWIAPLLLSWTVAIHGFNFSYQGREWQSRNISLVATIIGLSIFTGVICGILFLKLISKYTKSSFDSKYLLFTKLIDNSNLRNFFVVSALMLLALFGLFKSFGGTIFEKNYTGAVSTWLNVGAWSVLYLISLSFIFGRIFSRYCPNLKLATFSILFFIPVLLCGSRIDFLSFSFPLIISLIIFNNKSLYFRFIQVFSFCIFLFFITFYIGALRYNINIAEMPMLPTVAIPESKIIYLSTIGDIGSSVFQIVGLVNSHEMSIIGISHFFHDYFLRLIPGFILQNRPGDFAFLGLINFGGGALHAIGEGFLISKMFGVLFVSFIFGLLGAFSGFFAEQFKKNPSAFSWFAFAFPWLILIRGGWYQFFAVFKGLEIFVIFLLLLFVLGKIDV